MRYTPCKQQKCEFVKTVMSCACLHVQSGDVRGVSLKVTSPSTALH